ncbi:DNA-binding SARP family transcriptional activator [Arthrobacter sp. SLBN-100]|uniref:BTAD domain-containing putative transcriptional regulator n=1 Tax=Arthrobacter sp. SLBN-100 TaxID=2768450 RepID=UPI00115474BD|nr:BTAD domain-containing putative transcriptional regulator [Arthrobacter sp. SLBN-100]TQJ67611.1 DNA-binding SARP family transcriptional activator [Arthrobacter sp. SLBN-100]
MIASGLAVDQTMETVLTGAKTCRLEVRIIGPLRIRRGETVLGYGQLGGPKPRQIFELLLLNLGVPVSKDRLIDILWAGQAPAEALPTLESYVSVLRRHLQPGMGKDGPLRTVTGGYMLDRSLVDLDLDRFEALVRAAESAAPERAVVLLQEALELASAPLLGEELVPLWAESERARHAARVFRARILAAESALALGRTKLALICAREAVTDDPLSEQAWTVLVLGLEKSGQPTEALRAFDQCRRIMNRELGCSPGAALRSIYARLLEATTHVIAPPAAPVLDDTPTIRVMIINRHRTLTDLLVLALDREPDMLSVGTADSAQSGVDLVRELAPDVVLLGNRLRDDDGMAAALRILADAPHTRVLMLAGMPTPEMQQQAAAAGISAFLPKDGSLATLLSAVRRKTADASIS